MIYTFNKGAVTVEPNTDKWSENKFMLVLSSKDHNGWGITKSHNSPTVSNDEAKAFYVKGLQLLGIGDVC